MLKNWTSTPYLLKARSRSVVDDVVVVVDGDGNDDYDVHFV